MFIKYIFLFCLVVGFSLAEVATTVPAEISNSSAESKFTFDTTIPGVIDVKSKSTTLLPNSAFLLKTSSSTLQTSPPTPPPNVTTTSSPAPSPAPNSTTTSSAPTPTTTQIPTPPEVWTVTNSTDNITCIIAKMDIVLEVHQQNWTKNFTGNPRTVNANGECGMDIQTLEIIWPSDKSSSSASLIFIFNGTDNKYFISSLATSIFLNTSAGNKTLNDTRSLNLYETGKNTSYSCPLYVLNFEVNTTSVKLSMNDIQIEAFRFTNSTIFSSANRCSSGEVPDIVPLIVGLALAGLVIVVVIGYFIGRRRSQARGYLSM